MGRKKDPQPFLGVGGFPPEVQVKSGNQWPLLVFIGFKTFFFFFNRLNLENFIFIMLINVICITPRNCRSSF